MSYLFSTFPPYFSHKLLPGTLGSRRKHRNSYLKCFIKVAVLKNALKIHKKRPVRRLFFNARGCCKDHALFAVSFPKIVLKN